MANKLTKNEAANVLYVYPKSEDINIDKTNLHIQLGKFKEAVLDSFSLDSCISFLLTLSAVWVPMFTSDFKTILGYEPSLIKGGYFGFALLVSFYSVYKFIIKPVWFYFFSGVVASQDPEKMSQIILDKCSKG